MIEFKIIACPDRSQQSTYQHMGQELTIGQTEGDMIIDDPQLAPLQVKIYREGNAYLVENLDEEIEVRLNGRAISGPTPVKERDNLNMGRTVINLSALNNHPLQPPPPYEHPQASLRFTPGSKEKAILDALELQAKLEGSAAPPNPGNMPKPPIPPSVKPPPPRKG